MVSTASADSRSPLTVVGVAAGGVAAAVLTTVAADPLTTRMGIAGTIIPLALMWTIALVVVGVWSRAASSPSMGIRRLGLRDAGIAIVAGIVLALLVPLLSVGAMRFGVRTGTVETASQLTVGLAVAGVLTAAVTEEIIFRAAAMGALAAVRAPTVLVLILPALVFTSIHWSWGSAHTVFVVFPMSLALGALFLWRRSLLVNVIAHLVADLPVIVLAAAAT